MAMRRRRFRRRRGANRWFRPNVWTDSGGLPTLNTTQAVPAASVVFSSDIQLTSLLYGTAPFVGVANAAGRITGAQLGERTWWKHIRTVGRLSFVLDTDSQSTEAMGVDSWAMLNWGLLRWKMDDTGAPTAPAPRLFSAEDQDERWLYRDSWVIHPGTAPFNETQGLVWAGPLPFGDYVDIRTRRFMGNEMDLYLVTQFAVFLGTAGNRDFAPGEQLSMYSWGQLRVLGRFGR